MFNYHNNLGIGPRMAYTSEIDKLERRWKENPQGTVFAPLAEVYRKAAGRGP